MAAPIRYGVLNGTSGSDLGRNTTDEDTVLSDGDAEETADEALLGLSEVVEEEDVDDDLAAVDEVEEPEEPEEPEEAEDAEDLEEALDVVLAARLTTGHPDDDLDDDDEGDDIGPDGLADVVPLRRSDEFLCKACFLLKKTTQLADRSAQLCRDCA